MENPEPWSLDKVVDEYVCANIIITINNNDIYNSIYFLLEYNICFNEYSQKTKIQIMT